MVYSLDFLVKDAYNKSCVLCVSVHVNILLEVVGQRLHCSGACITYLSERRMQMVWTGVSILQKNKC